MQKRFRVIWLEVSPREAARRMGLSQSDLSRLLNGQFRDVSIERLMRLQVTHHEENSQGRMAAIRPVSRFQSGLHTFIGSNLVSKTMS